MTWLSPKALCRHHKLAPKKSLGQNFLVHPDQARRLVAALEVQPQDTVVEIGAGLGALTLLLAQEARQVVALELDCGLIAVLEGEVLAGRENVQVVCQDALTFDFAGLSRRQGSPLAIIGNLPYQITSPLFFKLLADKAALRVMVLMMQLEVGERLVALPGGKDYGILSVLLQYHFRLEKLFSLSPGNFYPAPRVDSVVLRFFPQTPPLPARDEAYFTRLVKAAFATRRKTLKNCLSGQAASLGLAPAALPDILRTLDLDPGRRPETLSVLDFVRLSNAIQELGG
mgnify:CR=1 FL=1